MKKTTIGVIGLGHVGAHVAFALASQGIADELLLVDMNEKKLVSERQDLFDAGMFMPHRVEVRQADFKDLGCCSVIVNCVGDINILRANRDRTDELKFTINAVNGYVDKIMASGFDGVIINVTNPCDVVTRQIAKLSGLPKGRVFGTGTGLDSARLRSALAEQTGIDHKSINAFMIGEHGASQMAAWSNVSFAGKTLEEMSKVSDKFIFDREEMQKKVIGAGWVTFSGKFCTEYGICSTAARLASIVLHDEKQIMPVSTQLDGEFGQSGDYIFAGVPAVIGANGVEQVIEINLSDEEKAKFKSCCDDIRKNMKIADQL